MKKVTGIILGIALIVVGVVFALNAFGVTDIDLFFDGWWTLFIVIPCVIGLFTQRDKIGNIIGILIGVVLFLCCQDVLSFSIIWKLVVPVIIVVIGLKIVFKAIFTKKSSDQEKKKLDGKKHKKGFAAFSGCDMKCDGERFEGAELTAIFGGVECDLRNAVIENDCVIQAVAVFGGIDILVSGNVNVKVDSNSIFGGIENKASSNQDVPTVYINATCVFGGVEIK